MSTPTIQRHGARAVACAVAIALAGCQAGAPFRSPGSSSQTLAERQLQQDQDRVTNTVFAATLTGAAGGAVVGILGSVLTGNTSKKDLTRNAAIGAVGGAVLVGVDGYVTAKKEQAGRQGIRASQAAANDMQKENANLQSYLDNSTRVLAEGRTRLANLKRDVAARSVSADEACRAREREEGNIANMNEALAKSRATRQQYAEASTKLRQGNENTGSLDNEIKRMDAQIGQLEKTVSAYREAVAVSRA